MLKIFVFAILAIGCLSLKSNPIPIPAGGPDGYSRGSNTPQLHLEAYYDLLCPGCQNQWEILEPLLKSVYNIDSNQTLRFTIHVFPLPYHIHAFTAAQGAKVISQNQAQQSDIYTYLDIVFKNQDSFQTDATLNQSSTQVQNALNKLVVAQLPNTSSYFLSGLASGNQYDVQARVSWKYATSRQVTGTPTFFANGVQINGAYGFEAADWRRFIDGGYVNYIRKAQTQTIGLIEL